MGGAFSQENNQRQSGVIKWITVTTRPSASNYSVIIML